MRAGGLTAFLVAFAAHSGFADSAPSPHWYGAIWNPFAAAPVEVVSPDPPGYELIDFESLLRLIEDNLRGVVEIGYEGMPFVLWGPDVFHYRQRLPVGDVFGGIEVRLHLAPDGLPAIQLIFAGMEPLSLPLFIPPLSRYDHTTLW